MRIDVAPTPAELSEADERTAVVVIDVFRAATTITTALTNGARFVLPTIDVEQAVRLLEPYAESEAVLGGERDCRRIDGFHLGNSPHEYTREAVAGKVVILTTTNGTRALALAADAGAVFVGCLLNAGALCRELAGWPRVLLVCAGNKGQLSLEDWLCAGAMVARLVEHDPATEAELPERPRTRVRRRLTFLADPDKAALGDSAYAAWAAHTAAKPEMSRLLRSTEHARHLAELGFGADLDFALRVDSLPVVPRFADGRIRLDPARR
jgi:2-phosphosulfolactate phosphatase